MYNPDNFTLADIDCEHTSLRFRGRMNPEVDGYICNGCGMYLTEEQAEKLFLPSTEDEEE